MAQENENIQQEQAKQLALEIATILDKNKAQDIKILYVSNQTVIADYFVIAEGTSTTQVNSLADEVRFRLSQKELRPMRVEGENSGSWVLLDYASVIVHVFLNSQRDFYKLEKLWADGEEVPFEQMED